MVAANRSIKSFDEVLKRIFTTQTVAVRDQIPSGVLQVVATCYVMAGSEGKIIQIILFLLCILYVASFI